MTKFLWLICENFCYSAWFPCRNHKPVDLWNVNFALLCPKMRLLLTMQAGLPFLCLCFTIYIFSVEKQLY